MNKLLIVLLAICLVSVHAFVKRDAPAPAPEKDYFKEFGEQFQKTGQKVSEDIKNAFQPETMKKNFNEFVDEMNKLMKGNADKPQ